MALLKACRVAKPAILLNWCMGFSYSSTAVRRHCLVFKEKSQNVMGLICTWDRHRHVCAIHSNLPFSSTPAALRSLLLGLFHIVIELLGRAPFLIPSMFYSNEFTSFHPFYMSSLLSSPYIPSFWRLELFPGAGHQVTVPWAALSSLSPLPGAWRKSTRMQG